MVGVVVFSLARRYTQRIRLGSASKELGIRSHGNCWAQLGRNGSRDLRGGSSAAGEWAGDGGAGGERPDLAAAGAAGVSDLVAATRARKPETFGHEYL